MDPQQVQARLEDAQTRLNLSAEQRAKLEPLLRARTEQMRAIRDKYAGDDSRRTKRRMFREARDVQKAYEGKVREILDDSQQAEWEAMRKEAMEQFKAWRQSGGTLN